MSTPYKRRFGDRKEGRLLRSLPGFARFIPYIMPTRNDACNYYEESFEDVFVLENRASGQPHRHRFCGQVEPVKYYTPAFVQFPVLYIILL